MLGHVRWVGSKVSGSKRRNRFGRFLTPMPSRLIQPLPKDGLATGFHPAPADRVALLYKGRVTPPPGLVSTIQGSVASALALGFIARTPSSALPPHRVERPALSLGLTRFLPGRSFGTAFAKTRLRRGTQMITALIALHALNGSRKLLGGHRPDPGSGLA